MSKNKIGFVDSEWKGHHSEYVNHILRFLDNNHSKFNSHDFFFHLHPQMEKLLIDVKAKNVYISYYDNEDLARIEASSTFRRSKIEGECISKFANRTKVNTIFLLVVNVHLFNYLYSGFSHQKKLMGILFHPHIRISPHTFQARLKKFLKSINLKLFIKFNKPAKLFILNDVHGAKMLNESICPCFEMLPDPINGRTDVGVQNEILDVVRFSFLGYINQRKGLIQALMAFDQMDLSQSNQNIILNICGEVENEIRDDVESLVQKIKNKNKLEVNYDCRFLSEDEFESVLEKTDVVLMPYLRAIGSSGMLGHAARYGLRVIGPQDGLIAELIADYQLGYAIDPNDLKKFTELLYRIMSEEKTDIGETYKSFIEERKPEVFAEKIISSLI